MLLAACSSSATAKLSSKALCENGRGKYVQGMCQPGSPRSAHDVCVAYGGVLVVNENLCHIPVR